MDYNDLQLRLSRTFDSIDARFSDNIEEHISVEEWENGKGVSFHFGSENESQLLNQVMIILYNLTSLKDHLKNAYSEKNLNPSLIEAEINNSMHLQVLMDIVNQDKHGTPLNRERSGKNPKIIGLRNGMFMADRRTGEEKFTMEIFGTIVDGAGNRLFRLDDLIDVCFHKWELMAKAI